MQDLSNKVDGANTLPADQWNEAAKELVNIIEANGQAPSQANLLQVLNSIVEYGVKGTYHTDSGVDGIAYALTPTFAGATILSYKDGMTFKFEVAVGNISASPTINVSGLGPRNLTLRNGLAISAGTLLANNIISVIYRSSSDSFEIESGVGGSGSRSIESFTSGTTWIPPVNAKKITFTLIGGGGGGGGVTNAFAAGDLIPGGGGGGAGGFLTYEQDVNQIQPSYELTPGLGGGGGSSSTFPGVGVGGSASTLDAGGTFIISSDGGAGGARSTSDTTAVDDSVASGQGGAGGAPSITTGSFDGVFSGKHGNAGGNGTSAIEVLVTLNTKSSSPGVGGSGFEFQSTATTTSGYGGGGNGGYITYDGVGLDTSAMNGLSGQPGIIIVNVEF